MPSREAAQLKASGLGSHVAVKRAGMEGREAYWSAAARDCGKAREKITDVRKTKGVPAGHHGGKHLSGLDGCQWIPCASAVRCARAAIEPTHVGHGERRSAHGARRFARDESARFVSTSAQVSAQSSQVKTRLVKMMCHL